MNDILWKCWRLDAYKKGALCFVRAFQWPGLSAAVLRLSVIVFEFWSSRKGRAIAKPESVWKKLSVKQPCSLSEAWAAPRCLAVSLCMCEAFA